MSILTDYNQLAAKLNYAALDMMSRRQGRARGARLHHASFCKAGFALA